MLRENGHLSFAQMLVFRQVLQGFEHFLAISNPGSEARTLALQGLMRFFRDNYLAGLEALSEALLDFMSLANLAGWLANRE